jgi:hypothetical protein
MLTPRGALHFLCIDRTGEIRVLQHGRQIRLRSSEDPRYHGRGDLVVQSPRGRSTERARRSSPRVPILGFAAAASLTGARSSTGSIRWSLTCRKKLAHTLRHFQTWADPSQAGKASPIRCDKQVQHVAKACQFLHLGFASSWLSLSRNMSN